MRPPASLSSRALTALVIGAAAVLLGAAPARARPDENLEKIAEALSDLATALPKDPQGDRTKIAEAAKALGGGPEAEAAQALVEALDADWKGDARAAGLAGERAEAVMDHIGGKIMKRAGALALLCGARWERTKDARDRRAEAAMVAFGVSAESAEGERWLELARAGEAARLLGRADEAAASWKDAVACVPEERRREVSAALGRVLDELGRVREAAQVFESALGSQMPPSKAARAIGSASGAPGTVLGPEAVDDASLIRARALALERAGDPVAAIAALGSTQLPGDEPFGLRARLGAATGAASFPADALEAQLAKTALHPLVRSALAERALAKGETRTALEHARVAFAFAPRNPRRAALFLRVAAAAGDQGNPGGEWAQAARWKKDLDEQLEAAHGKGLEHPTATALRAAERAIAAGDPQGALAKIGEPPDLDGEAQLLKLRALEGVGLVNRSKVTKAATALMKRYGDAPELRALGGTPPPGSASAGASKGAARGDGATAAADAASTAQQEFMLAQRDGTGLAVTFAAIGAAILAGGAALFVLRKKPSSGLSAPPLPVPASSVPATRRYEKPKSAAPAPSKGAPDGERRLGPKEIAIGAIAALVLAGALYKIYDAFALPPQVDATVRARLTGDPVPLYARRGEDAVLATVPPGTPLTLGHELARPPEGQSVRVTVAWKKEGDPAPVYGYVEEKDLVAEDLAGVRQRRLEAIGKH